MQAHIMVDTHTHRHLTSPHLIYGQQAPTTTTTSLGQDSLIHAVAGGFGSSLALAVTYPLDQVRTFQQVHDNEEDDAYIQHGGRSPLLTGATCDAAASGSGAAWWAAHVAPLLRPWRSATLLVQRHGPGALYRGIVPVLVSMGVSNAVFFFVSSLLKAVLTRYRQKTGRSLGYFGHLATSTVAGVLNVLLTTPLWVRSSSRSQASRRPGVQRVQCGQVTVSPDRSRAIA